MRPIYTLLFLLFMSSIAVKAQDLTLGEIDFPVTVKTEAAKAAFMEGALLLHSFEYEDAREAFQEAQRLEPGFYMAYWGEAMTHNHSLWGRQNKEAAQEVLEKLGPSTEVRLRKAPTARERAFMAAVEAMYGAKDKRAGDYAYNEAMGNMYEAFSDDDEVASFYALSFLGISHDGRDFRKYIKCASIVETVYEKNPLHPGALHYLIHSYDDPIHSELGLRAAHRYAKVAPSAAHALHMPSHIFITIGDWDRVVACNEDSWRASLARQTRKGLDITARGYHSFWWLAYAYLQQGNLAHANLLIDSMVVDGERNDAGGIVYHLNMMRSHHLIESENWDHKVFAVKPQIDIRPSIAAVYHYTNGIVYWKKGEMDQLSQSMEALEALIPTQLPIVTAADAASCCAPLPDSKKMGKNGQLSAEVMLGCLKAIKLYEAGNVGPALTVLREASELESSIPLRAGPPQIVKPSHELLGEFLLAEGQFEAAQAAFAACLERNPGRRISLLGLEKAKEEVLTQTDKR